MRRVLYILILMFLATACKEDIVIPEGATDIVFEDNEPVLFTTNIPTGKKTTRAYTIDEEIINAYATVQEDYAISVKMFEENVNDPIGVCTYKPIVRNNQFDEDGTLMANPTDQESRLLWETNQKKYAFEANAGTEELGADQGTKELWLAQDKLHGYACIPLKEGEKNVDDIETLNYHTNKEWGALNREWRTLDNQNQMLSTEHYKYIPLFLQHQRSWITLKLKAGKGVSREALKFEEAQKNCQVTFYSYKTGETEPLEITSSWAQPAKVDYEKDKNGEAVKDAETTCYNVIVEPYNYYSNAEQKIASISLSGLKFSFSAKNDDHYEASINTENPDYQAAQQAMDAYNLNPSGKHLTITATLSTDRIVFITAWIEDWTTVTTTTICDDYGQNGDPILINSRQDLIDFLEDPDLNKPGNVAIVVANMLDLDKKVTDTGTTDDPWSNYANDTLNATLNMAGARFNSKSRLFEDISSSGSLINGTVVIGAPVASAIAETNSGTIERIAVMMGSDDGIKASEAGLVGTNYATIYQCSSALPVYGNNTEDTYIYIGGIAARSISLDGTTMPVIDACTVTSAVKGQGKVKGGGIVGLADGRVSNNTFEYGITLLQEAADFKNIIADKTTRDLRAENNHWPTLATNGFDGTDNTNANTTAVYDYVLDCEEELAKLLTMQRDTEVSRFRKFRLSNSFTVSSDTWTHGLQHDDTSTEEGDCKGNLYCEIDGNNMTITLDGIKKVQVPTEINNQGKATAWEEKETCAMLFSNITGSIYDLTIQVSKPLIAAPSTSSSCVLDATDAIAPLAYAVKGHSAVVRNIKVKLDNDAYVQAALPAGLVCWAYEDATVEACQVKGNIQSWIPPTNISGSSSDSRRYAGGIVGVAAKATIKECIFHTENNTLGANTNTAQIYHGGILGGTTVKDINGIQEHPAVSIIDCTSWYNPEEESTSQGAILGYAIYVDNNVSKNGTVIEGANKCDGNWWSTTTRGVGQVLPGMTIEGVIGTCNNYTPTKDNKY